jgi:hypothetical protein
MGVQRAKPLPEREVSSLPPFPQRGPQARQKNDEWMSDHYCKYVHIFIYESTTIVTSDTLLRFYTKIEGKQRYSIAEDIGVMDSLSGSFVKIDPL